MTWRILEGDCRDRLRELPADSVHCVVTSPPYWALRDYGVERQIGLEDSVEAWVAEMVAVFEEVRRVLRPDGTLWLNLGDSYAGGAGGDPYSGFNSRWKGQEQQGKQQEVAGAYPCRSRKTAGLAPKSLLGQPWRVAFALQSAGWILRSEIIWSKPNPMPESASDRPTKSHETVFLLSKSPRYFYDAEAVRERATGGAHPRRRDGAPSPKQAANGFHREAGFGMSANQPVGSRNARSVWTINPQPFREAHFATFPEALPRRCILAGTSAHGCCSSCGAAWTRVVEKGAADVEQQRACGGDAAGGYDGEATKDYGAARAQDPSAVKARILAGMRERRTVGWEPSCDCTADVVPCTVLDPFAGAGTTLLAAERLGRDSIGVELNPEYAEIARRRIEEADPTASIEVAPGRVQRSLFAESEASAQEASA